MACVDRIVILHPLGQQPLALIDASDHPKPIVAHAFDPADDPHAAQRAAARKWALGAWRGGLGGATCYDELLPAGPLLAAMQAHGADAAAIVGGDWCGFDPALASLQLKRLTDAPDAMKLTFTQAPPGLGAICVSRALLEDLAQHGAGFHHALWYNPRRPTIDPIGKEVCLPIPPQARDTFARFIYDTPRGIATLRQAADELADDFSGADISRITATHPSPTTPAHPPTYPHHLTLELTPRREVAGPVTPQHYTTLDRSDMDTALAIDLARQVAAMGDTTLMLGHLGDPLLHPDWEQVITAADEAGCFALGIETDLLCEAPVLERLASLPLDVIVVRINADTAATYERVMGEDRFERVARNLQRLFELKRERTKARGNFRGEFRGGNLRGGEFRGWVVPKLVKVRDNVREIESFFDRWVVVAGFAVIDRFDTGGGVAADLSPVPMDPPVRLATPMDGCCGYVLSNGLLTTDRSDWSGGNALGSVSSSPLREIWQQAGRFAEAV